MRKITLLLLFLMMGTAYCQFRENFNDGNFTFNPSWAGTNEQFIINSSQQLQLNTAGSGNAYLTTPYKLFKGHTWSIWVKLGFNTSSQNFARFYISSNTANPITSQYAYYIMMGGSSDKVSLVKKTGVTTTEIISAPEKELDKTSVSMNIKVELSHNYVWKLFVKYPTDNDFVLKGEYTDNALLAGNYIGPEAIYTSTNSKAFYFDDIAIDSIPERDTITPKLLVTKVMDNQTIALQYSEELDLSNAKFLINQSVGEPSTMVLSSDKKTVQLSFVTPFENGINYSLTISGIKDLSNNETPTETVNFYYWQTLSNPKPGDVVISEIMANPSGATLLPEVEYVELHNNTNQLANLFGWKFYYDNKAYTLPEYKLYPDSFVILCNQNSASKFRNLISKIGIESLPSFSNTGQLIYLENPNGEPISFAEYSDKWYNDEFKTKGGFSLECIDLNNISGSSKNWTASKDSKGGTPSSKNSVNEPNKDSEIPIITQSSLISPDTILIKFSCKMDNKDLNNCSNFTITPSTYSVRKSIANYPLTSSVILVLNESLKKDSEINIRLKDIKSISGISMQQIETIRLAISDTASFNDLIINEIVFNPRGTGADFVELYNRSKTIIDLSQIYLCSRKADGTFQSGVKLTEKPTPLFPEEYLVFTTNRDNILTEYRCKNQRAIIQLPSLPSLANDQGNIYIINTMAKIIDGFQYSEKMHHPFIKNAEGVSLERINSERPTNDPTNWQSASSEAGWATPGYRNSQASTSRTNNSEFSLENETVTPDNNGRDDVLRIHYLLPQPGYTANIQIYSPSGKLVATVATNATLGTEGIINWDATSTNKQIVSPGIYLLYIEYYKQNTAPKQIKKTVVIGN